MIDTSKNFSRRDFIKKASLLAAAGLTAPYLFSAKKNHTSENLILENGGFTLPELPYAFDALEPYIDKMTMEIHYTKHHAAYVNNLNKALAENKLQNISMEGLLKNASKYPASIHNNAGGHWNHSFFWKLMRPANEEKPNGKLAHAITSEFGSLDAFKAKFTDAALKRFGSGWAWLVLNKKGHLEITSTPNQDNPLMDVSEIKGTPILGIDVWEHAYYLKYQNKRADYISAWWKLVNWEEAEKNYLSAK